MTPSAPAYALLHRFGERAEPLVIAAYERSLEARDAVASAWIAGALACVASPAVAASFQKRIGKKVGGAEADAYFRRWPELAKGATKKKAQAKRGTDLLRGRHRRVLVRARMGRTPRAVRARRQRAHRRRRSPRHGSRAPKARRIASTEMPPAGHLWACAGSLYSWSRADRLLRVATRASTPRRARTRRTKWDSPSTRPPTWASTHRTSRSTAEACSFAATASATAARIIVIRRAEDRARCRSRATPAATPPRARKTQAGIRGACPSRRSASRARRARA